MKGGKVLGLFSAPGGVGKTTIAALTAWFARESGSRVLAIDMDLVSRSPGL
ncbi:MAG: AAA family ATPase [Candidatus Korarchaeota archaeon]|nr:AAA family ATPase [Candidatus Korarchaeota archaeon]